MRVESFVPDALCVDTNGSPLGMTERAARSYAFKDFVVEGHLSLSLNSSRHDSHHFDSACRGGFASQISQTLLILSDFYELTPQTISAIAGHGFWGNCVVTATVLTFSDHDVLTLANVPEHVEHATLVSNEYVTSTSVGEHDCEVKVLLTSSRVCVERVNLSSWQLGHYLPCRHESHPPACMCQR